MYARRLLSVGCELRQRSRPRGECRAGAVALASRVVPASCPVVPHRSLRSRRSRGCSSASPSFLAGDSDPDGADGREGPTSKPACPSWWGTEGSTPSLLRQPRSVPARQVGKTICKYKLGKRRSRRHGAFHHSHFIPTFNLPCPARARRRRRRTTAIGG